MNFYVNKSVSSHLENLHNIYVPELDEEGVKKVSNAIFDLTRGELKKPGISANYVVTIQTSDNPNYQKVIRILILVKETTYLLVPEEQNKNKVE